MILISYSHVKLRHYSAVNSVVVLFLFFLQYCTARFLIDLSFWSQVTVEGLATIINDNLSVQSKFTKSSSNFHGILSIIHRLPS